MVLTCYLLARLLPHHHIQLESQDTHVSWERALCIGNAWLAAIRRGEPGV